jgi:hypothetical protein
MAHIPGPWIVFDRSDVTPSEPFWIGADHPEVGEVTFASVRNGCDEAAELGDLEANARLIAAAPELFNACVLTLKWLEQNAPAWSATDEIAELRRVIKKANGS